MNEMTETPKSTNNNGCAVALAVMVLLVICGLVGLIVKVRQDFFSTKPELPLPVGIVATDIQSNYSDFYMSFGTNKTSQLEMRIYNIQPGTEIGQLDWNATNLEIYVSSGHIPYVRHTTNGSYIRFQ